MRAALIGVLFVSLFASQLKAETMEIVGVERDSVTSVKLKWMLRNAKVIENGSVSLQFVAFDAINPDTKELYTQDERVNLIQQQFTEYANSYISRFKGGEGDFNKYVQTLNGFIVTK